jgi:type II restriction/modification system DNA methylase subunit YeeA
MGRRPGREERGGDKMKKAVKSMLQKKKKKSEVHKGNTYRQQHLRILGNQPNAEQYHPNNFKPLYSITYSTDRRHQLAVLYATSNMSSGTCFGN